MIWSGFRTTKVRSASQTIPNLFNGTARRNPNTRPRADLRPSCHGTKNPLTQPFRRNLGAVVQYCRAAHANWTLLTPTIFKFYISPSRGGRRLAADLREVGSRAYLGCKHLLALLTQSLLIPQAHVCICNASIAPSHKIATQLLCKPVL